jgi:hypothetical protein
MGSAWSKRVAIPLAATALAAFPAGASGMLPKDYSMNGATGDYAPAIVHTNYALNGATGTYAPAITRAHRTVRMVEVQQSRGFAWGAAAAGAAVGLLVLLAVGLTSVRIHRRRTSAPSPARPRPV